MVFEDDETEYFQKCTLQDMRKTVREKYILCKIVPSVWLEDGEYWKCKIMVIKREIWSITHVWFLMLLFFKALSMLCGKCRETKNWREKKGLEKEPNADIEQPRKQLNTP